MLARDAELVGQREQARGARVAVLVQRVAEAGQRRAALAVLAHDRAPDRRPTRRRRAASSRRTRWRRGSPSRSRAARRRPRPGATPAPPESVIRAACTLGTSPCSAIATRQASVMRRSRSSGARPMSSRKNISVSVRWPISSEVRSWPRTVTASAVASAIAVLASVMRYILQHRPRRWLAEGPLWMAGGSCQEMEPAVDFFSTLSRFGLGCRGRTKLAGPSALSCHPPEDRLRLRDQVAFTTAAFRRKRQCPQSHSQ